MSERLEWRLLVPNVNDKASPMAHLSSDTTDASHVTETGYIALDGALTTLIAPEKVADSKQHGASPAEGK